MPVTIKQIAQYSGLSIQTVSRILNYSEYDKYLPETREKVLRVAQELGYRPNSTAQATRTGRFNTFALLLSTSNAVSNLPRALLAGIHEAIQAHDLQLNVTQLPYEHVDTPRFIPKVLRQWSVDGLLVNYTHYIPEKLFAYIREHTLPSVWINSKQEANCVYPDDFTAGKQATEHLLGMGHRAICYVTDIAFSGITPHYSVLDRQAGYEAAMRAAGLTPCVFLDSVYRRSWTEMNPARQELLTGPHRPTALLGYSYEAMQPLVHTALSLGFSFWEDLSVVCFEADVARDLVLGVNIATWVVPNYAIGMQAVEMLTARVKDVEVMHPPVSLPFTLQSGETCAPPRST